MPFESQQKLTVAGCNGASSEFRGGFESTMDIAECIWGT